MNLHLPPWIDRSEWEPVGSRGAWYRVGKPHTTAYYIKTCEWCDREYLGRQNQRFCSASCAAFAVPPSPRKDTPKYQAAHSRVWKVRGKASDHACVDCGSPADEWSYDHADPDEVTDKPSRFAGNILTWSAKPEHYKPRCAKCHRTWDGLVGDGHPRPRAKLAENAVREIRLLHATGQWSQKALGEKYDTPTSNISKIVTRRNWKHVE